MKRTDRTLPPGALLQDVAAATADEESTDEGGDDQFRVVGTSLAFAVHSIVRPHSAKGTAAGTVIATAVPCVISWLLVAVGTRLRVRAGAFRIGVGVAV